MWFLDQLEPGNPFYNVAISARIAGSLDAQTLQAALQAVVRRQSALRTTFHSSQGHARQVVQAAGAVTLELSNLGTLAPELRTEHLQKLATSEALRPFDLEKGPLLRAQLITVDSDDHVLLLTLHHIICDGWSIAVLRDELAELYTAILAGRPPRLDPLPIDYVDFACWQRGSENQATQEEHLHYWLAALADLPGPLELPLDHARPATQDYRGDVRRRAIDAELLGALRRLAAEENATLGMVLMAAWQVVLARFSREQDIRVGTPIANRGRPELERLIGFFANTLVIRGRLEANPAFHDFLAQMRETMLAAYAHQDLPFEQLVERLHPQRELNRNPLVQVMFVLQNIPLRTREISGISLRDASFDHAPIANFDLTLNIDEHPDRLGLSLVYSTALFEPATVERWLDAYQAVLAAIVADRSGRVLELPLLSASERARLLSAAVAAETPIPHDQCIHDLFVAQARRTPDAQAVLFEDQVLTYGELDRHSSRLARHLITRGAGPEVPVGLCLDRSPELIVGLLAILKAGAAYVPLDPHYPLARRLHMIDDARLPLIVTDSTLAADLTARDCRQVLIDKECDGIAACSDEPLPAGAAPQRLANIIYTSGSSGAPKGVEIEHHGLVNHALALAKAYRLGPGDRLLQYLSLSFDAAGEEIFPTLIAGAALHLHPAPAELAGRTMLDWSRDNGVNVLHLPVAVWSSLVDELAVLGAEQAQHLKVVLAGGDSLAAEQLRRWRAATGNRVRFLFAYGVTEATITTTVFDGAAPLPATASSCLPIGRPVPNQRVYVLDEFGQPVPSGVAGELAIGGIGIARGYRGRPELSRERFVRDPFSAVPQARMYRTGDLVRSLADGNLEFLGRVDRQVKVRGCRIEPAEIEAVLQLHPAVREAVVVPCGVGASRRLAAYVGCVPGALPTEPELLAFLAERLPGPMLPAALVVMKALPRLACAKVDVSSLPAPCWQRAGAHCEFIAPRNEVEQTLAGIWCDVLGVERVGVHENFFDLGGDSIRMIQVVARAGAAGLRITPKQLFQNQTIAEAAAVVTFSPRAAAPQGPLSGPAALLPVQHEFFALGPADAHHNNQSVLLTVARGVTVASIELAISKLIAYHDALRSRFTQSTDGAWSQTITDVDEGSPLEQVDLSSVDDTELPATIERIAGARQATLDLAAGPLVRAVYFDLGGERPGRLLIVIHHLVVDAVSWRILVGDLNSLCAQHAAGSIAALPPKTTPVCQWAERLIALADSPAARSEAESWLAATAEPGDLPRDQAAGANVVRAEATVRVRLDRETTHQLLAEAATAGRARPHELLIAALAPVLSEFTGSPTIDLALEGHGREDLFADVDLSRTVGWFTALYPVVLSRPQNHSAVELLKSIKEQLRAIPNGGIGYGLLRWLTSDATLRERLAARRQPEVCFNYLGQFDFTLPQDALFGIAAESPGRLCSPRAARRHSWDIVAFVRDAELHIEWTYSADSHRAATIERLAADYVQSLSELIDACLAPEATVATPTDFPLAGVDQQDLDVLAKLLARDS